MESLTHTFSIKALLVLLKEDRMMTVEEIAAEMGEPHGSVVHAIDALRDGDLVEANSLFGEPHTIQVTLTPAGRIAAGKLREIESVIGWTNRGGVT